MRWIATLTLLLALAGGIFAAGPDDDYLTIYNQILQADALQQAGQSIPAAAKYAEAQAALQKFQAIHPDSNKEAVAYRLQYLNDKVKELAAFLPAGNGTPPPPKAAVVLTPQQQAAMWQEEIRALTNANAELEMKLKEALSVQPEAVSPAELVKAQVRINDLEKEKALLSVELGQQKAANSAPKADTAKLSAELAALQKRSAEADKLSASEIASLRKKLDEAQKNPAGMTDSDKVKQLKAERDKLKKDLAETSSTDADKLKAAEKERDDLRKQLSAVLPRPASQRGSASVELETLRARLAVLEAPKVPLTPEELAVLNSAPTPRVPTAPIPAKEPNRKIHSVTDLGPGLGEIMHQAQVDVSAQRYDDAEKKYQEILHQDENNIYVLFHLGSTQYAANRLDDCEKTVQRSLALDPQDPGTLYLLGVLRYRQHKLDEAMDALSRSAALNSTNAATQNYLGCVLAEKGLQPQAETALRTALELEPTYPDAHFNLSLVYAEEKPPSLALARWHYQKALDLGHEKSEKLEKMIAGGP